MTTRCKTVSFQPGNKENLDNININFTLNINKASFKASSLERKNVIYGKKIDNSQISLNNPTIMQYPILIEEPKKTIKMTNFIKKQENVQKSENKVEKTKVLSKKTEKNVNFDEIIEKIKQINPVLKKIFEMKGAEMEKGLEKLKSKGKKTKKPKKAQKLKKKPMKIENEENTMKNEKINQNIAKNEKINKEETNEEKLNKEEKIRKVDKLILENLKRIKLEKQIIEQQEYEEKTNKIRKMATIREKNQKIREFNKNTFLNKLSSGKTIRFISKTRGFSNEKQAKTSRNVTKKRMMTEEQLTTLREFMKNRRKMKKNERKIEKEPKKIKKDDSNSKKNNFLRKEQRRISEERIDRAKVFRTAAIFIQKFWRGFIERKYYKEVILGQNGYYSKNYDEINYPLKNYGEIENNKEIDELEATSSQKTKRIEGNYGRFVDSDEKNSYYLEKPRTYYKNYRNKEEFAQETRNFNNKTSDKNSIETTARIKENETPILLEKRHKNEVKSPKETIEITKIKKENEAKSEKSEESNKKPPNSNNPPEFFSKDLEIAENNNNNNNNNIICNNNNKETLIDLSASSNSCELKNREFQTNYYYENSRKSSRNLSINLDDEEKASSELFNKEIGKIHDFDNNLQPPLIKSGQKLDFSRDRWEKIKPRKLLGVLDKNLLKEAIDIREKARKIKPDLVYFDKKEIVRGFNRIIETLNKAKIDSHFIGNGSTFSRKCFSEGDGFISPSLILNTGSSLFSENNEKKNGNEGNLFKINEINRTETSKSRENIEKNALNEQNFKIKKENVDNLGKDYFEEKKEEKHEINEENPEKALFANTKLEDSKKGDKASKEIEDIEKPENSPKKRQISSVIEISKFGDTENNNFLGNHDIKEISGSGIKSEVVTHRNLDFFPNKFESQFSEPKIPIHNADSPERPSFFEETPLRLLEATSLIEPSILTVKFTDDKKEGFYEGAVGLENDSIKGKNKENDNSLVGVISERENELKQGFCFEIQEKVESFDDDVVSPPTTAQKKYEITDSQLSSVGNTPYENQGSSNFEGKKKEELIEEKYIYADVEFKSEEKRIVFAADAENECKNDKMVSPKESLKKPLVSSPLVATQTIPFDFTEKIDQKCQNDHLLEKNDKVTEALLDFLLEEVLRSNLVIKAFSHNSDKHYHQQHESSVKSPPKEYALESTSPPKKNKIIDIPSNAANFSLNRQKFNDLFLEYLIQFKSIILYEDQGLRNIILENLGKPLGTAEKEKLKTSRENSFKFTSMLNDNMILPYIDRRVIKKPVIPEEFYQKIQNSIAVEYCKIDQSYFKSVFDSCNDLLNCFRPFRDKSRPYPWEKGNRNKQKNIIDDDLNEILGKCLNKIETFPTYLCGIFLEKEGFPARSKMGSFEDFVARTREDKMKKMLVKEYEENEEDWQDFREDELELKLEISELVFQELVKEMAMEIKGKLKQ